MGQELMHPDMCTCCELGGRRKVFNTGIEGEVGSFKQSVKTLDYMG